MYSQTDSYLYMYILERMSYEYHFQVTKNQLYRKVHRLLYNQKITTLQREKYRPHYRPLWNTIKFCQSFPGLYIFYFDFYPKKMFMVGCSRSLPALHSNMYGVRVSVSARE